MMQAEGITVRRGDTLLVDNVSVTVSPGEVVALVGPNGAGKSTLLRVLSGDELPLYGNVQYRGQSAATWERNALARFRAVLPQQSTLEFDFTALDVVAMGREPWSPEPTNRRTAIANAALALVGMLEMSARRYPTLSGGEQQRVHLARVLAQVWPQPREDATSRGVGAVLLDEPVSSLDPQHQHRTLQLARAIAARGLAVLVVLHDLNLAVQYADRIVLLCRGRLVADGPARSVLSAAMLGEVYGTSFDIIPHPCADYPLVLARPSNGVIAMAR